MNIEKLREYVLITNAIPNYKKVCEVLDESIKAGDSKKSQLKEMERYFKYHKDGNKFVIDEIYEVPLEKVDNRKGNSGKSEGSRKNNNVYGKYIEQLVLDLLVQKYQNTQDRNIYLSRDKMLRNLNMINDNYSFCKFNQPILSSFISADNSNVREFYMLNNRNLYESVERALDSLASKCLVSWQLVTTVACGLTEFSKQVDMGDGDIASIFDFVTDQEDIDNLYKETHLTATAEQLDIILYAENEILEVMGLDSKKDAFLMDRYSEFNKKVCDLLQKTSNIKYYYKSYDVIFHEKVVQQLEKITQYILEQEEKQNIKVTLNGIISNNLVTNAETRQNKALEEESKVLGNSRKESFKQMKRERRCEENYIEDNQKIVDTIININQPKITETIARQFKDKGKKLDKDFDELLASL